MQHSTAAPTVLSTVSICSVDHLELSGETITDTQIFHACWTLSAADFTVASSGEVAFRAGQRITLNPGFRVQAGGRFTARIVPPIRPLNDTGIDWCADEDTNFLACPIASHPGQDGDYGRDALARAGQLQKVGAGAAGFDYTKLDANGHDLPASATNWSCVRDNHTGLIWEVKVDDPGHLRHKDHRYTWYNPDPNTNGGHAGTQDGGTCTGSACDTHAFVQAVNAQGLCGASDWRMPTVDELHSLVHHGRVNPAIDTDYFPHTSPFHFWSGSPSAYYSNRAWGVWFSGGGAHHGYRSDVGRVRLVRGGQ